MLAPLGALWGALCRRALLLPVLFPLGVHRGCSTPPGHQEARAARPKCTTAVLLEDHVRDWLRNSPRHRGRVSRTEAGWLW